MKVFTIAPDFELPDISGKLIHLSDYHDKKNVVLILLRGFMCPFCRALLARLRDDYAAFTSRDAEILALGPDSPEAFRRYWQAERLPFPGLPDPQHIVADIYGQEVNLLKLGRMPAMMLIDKKSQVRYQHYGTSMADVADSNLILGMLDRINRE
jgi:peroxiredoxin